MPPWLSNVLLIVAALAILYLLYRVFTSKRWI